MEGMTTSIPTHNNDSNITETVSKDGTTVELTQVYTSGIEQTSTITETTAYKIDTTQIQNSMASDKWFYVSIFLIIVVIACIVLFIVCFIRQRRFMKQTKTDLIRFSTKNYNFHNDGFEMESKNNEKSETHKKMEKSASLFTSKKVRKKEVGNIPRQINSNADSGFVSYSGSLFDRQKQDILNEAEVENINEFENKQDQCSLICEKQSFRIHEETREERYVRKCALLQKQESYSILSDVKEESYSFCDSKEDHDYYDCSDDPDKVLVHDFEQDYENSVTNLSSSSTDADYECAPPSAHNVENPTYGIVPFHNQIKDNSETNENLTSSKNNIESDEEYENTANSRNEFINDFRNQKLNSGHNFLNLEWDYKSIVNSNGGLLKAPNSDISLVLPDKFIPTMSSTMIYWSIFAQDCAINSRSDIELCIVSPIVEFFTPFKDIFDQHAIIEIPHCISEHADDKIQPYWFNPSITSSLGKLQIETIPKLENCVHKTSLPDVFYRKSRPGFLLIYTKHFSVYFCACLQPFPLELYAVTFGKYVPIDSSQVNIKIKVHIADAKITLKDCLEALKQDEQSLGYTFKGKTEIELDDDISKTDSIEIKVDFEDVPRNMNPIWKHSVDREGSPIHPVSKCWQFGNRFKCSSHKFIQTTKEWQFKNESPPRYRTVFQCFIEILYKKWKTEPIESINVPKYEKESDNDSVSSAGPNCITYSETQQQSTTLKSPEMPTIHNSASFQQRTCIRTRMTVDIDLSDTVIETEEIGNPSRRGIVPNIIYELIDKLEDDKFDEMCRRLGADKELRSMKSIGDSFTRGRRYDLLDSIRDSMSDGKFCKEVLTVLAIMKENSLKHAISEHIQKATLRTNHSTMSIEPQSSQGLIAVQHSHFESNDIDQDHDYVNDNTVPKFV